MHYRIIATLGPATAKPGTWRALLAAGTTTFRLNTSHLSVDDTVRWLDTLDVALENERPEVVLDLQGSKWRIGDIAPQELRRDEEVVLVRSAPSAEDAVDRVFGGGSEATFIPIPHADLFSAVPASEGILRLNDSKVELSVLNVSDESIRCVVTRGGPISSRKGVSVPGSQARREGLLPKDEQIVAATTGRRRIAYALSYLRDATEMRLLGRNLSDASRVIAKIERPEALAEAVDISHHCDAVWLCRGDLGAEVGGPAMARGVHEFTKTLPQMACPTILAGQVLEHMTHAAEPTRTEMCHLYDILTAGYAGIVLSDETAVGAYPIQSCRVAASYSTSSLERG